MKLSSLPLLVALASLFVISCNGGTPPKESADTTEAEVPVTTAAPQPSAIAAPADKFLSLSDIHFDPYYSQDGALIKALAAAEPKDWDAVFKQYDQPGYGNYGEDSNYNLFISALGAAKQASPDPMFVTISGDFLAHNYENSYQCLTKDYTEAGLQAFIVKSMKYIVMKLQDTYPNAVFFPTLGNNDSFCGDYQVEPNGAFLSAIAPIWQGMLGDQVDPGTFTQTFSEGGYYAATSPANPHHRILSLNSIFFSVKFMEDIDWVNYCSPEAKANQGNFCGTRPDAAAKAKAADEMISWLTGQLADAKAAGDQVWLIYHIPPGINAYATYSNQNGVCGSVVKPYWETTYNSQYMTIVNEYADIITAQLAGHSHMDNFIVLNDQGTPNNFVHITPAISPIFSNNPGFFHYEFDPAAASITDYTVHMFKDFESATSSNWTEEYRFSQVYNQSALNPQTLNTVAQQLNTDQTLQDKFIAYYIVDDVAQSGINPQNWPAYWCSMLHLTDQEFTDCQCGTKTTTAAVESH